MIKPSKEDVEKYGMTSGQRMFEIMALSMVFFALVAFFIKILFL